MVIQVSGALGTQMRYAAIRSEIVVLTNERLDSLEAAPLASIPAAPRAFSTSLLVRPSCLAIS